MGPKEVPQHKIEAAKEFLRKPLSEQFKAWETLRDRDFVNMRLSELAWLMAWYAELQTIDAVTRSRPAPLPLESGERRLGRGDDWQRPNDICVCNAFRDQHPRPSCLEFQFSRRCTESADLNRWTAASAEGLT